MRSSEKGMAGSSIMSEKEFSEKLNLENERSHRNAVSEAEPEPGKAGLRKGAAALVYLAPLRGVTDWIFRTAFERHFGRFDSMVTPFITTLKGKTVAATHVKDVAGPSNDRTRLVPQILGNDPEHFLYLAEHIHCLGYPGVNWNLGCPHPQVAGKRRGSGLLPFPGIVGEFLDRITPRMPCTLSVKVRLGLEDDRELERLMPVLNRFPLSEVIIHPRTGKQGYSGNVDLDRFRNAAELCIHPVVFNGDITSRKIFLKFQSELPEVSRWMIGRGVAQNPSLLASLRNGRDETCGTEVLRSFHDELFEENRLLLHGPSHLLGKMKEFWRYFASMVRDSDRSLKKIQRCTTVEQYGRLIGEIL